MLKYTNICNLSTASLEFSRENMPGYTSIYIPCYKEIIVKSALTRFVRFEFNKILIIQFHSYPPAEALQWGSQKAQGTQAYPSAYFSFFFFFFFFLYKVMKIQNYLICSILIKISNKKWYHKSSLIIWGALMRFNNFMWAMPGTVEFICGSPVEQLCKIVLLGVGTWG